MKRTDERLVSTAVFIFSFVLRKKSTAKVWEEWTNHADYDLSYSGIILGAPDSVYT